MRKQVKETFNKATKECIYFIYFIHIRYCDCNMFMRTNILIRKYSRCSVLVKTALFKSFCLGLYDTALWNNFNKCTKNKLKSAYNKCIKIFFG